jgi:hypothetical protein
MHDNIIGRPTVMPDLISLPRTPIRGHPGLFWIPASAEMTECVTAYDALYRFLKGPDPT